jgi:hypothetical protein
MRSPVVSDAFYMLLLMLVSIMVYLNIFNTIPSYIISQNSQQQGSRRKFLIGCNADAWKTYILNEFFYLFNTLTSSLSWEYAPIWLLRNKSQFLDIRPSVMLFCDSSVGDYDSYPMESLRQNDVMIAAWADDVQMYTKLFTLNQLVPIMNQTDVFFSTYGYVFETYMSPILKIIGTRPKVVWIPHSASPEFVHQVFSDDVRKEVLLAGAVEYVYPIRKWLKNVYAPHYPSKITILEHPGYGAVGENNTQSIASTLNRYIAGITCTSLYRYVVAKIFKIPAAGALLLIVI